MSEIRIKNISIIVDGQEYSFSGRSVVSNQKYDAAKDPEVQGTGLADLKQSDETSTEIAPVEPQPASGAPVPNSISEDVGIETTPASVAQSEEPVESLTAKTE
jgi:hypothetical protein